MRIATTLVLDMPVGCYYIYTPHLALSANVYLFKRRGLPLGRTSVSLHFPSLFLFLFIAPSLTLFSSFQESTTRSTPGNNAEIDQLFFTIHRESAGDRWGVRLCYSVDGVRYSPLSASVIAYVDRISAENPLETRVRLRLHHLPTKSLFEIKTGINALATHRITDFLRK